MSVDPFAGLPLGRDAFVAKVWQEGKVRYRDLPWRNLDDPYAVLVSEVMLQQTQVKRVLNYWPRFLGMLPTLDALAAADTALVLELWQGLGYNRRALALKRCAETCAANRAGTLPETYEELVALPGIGKATAAGVLAFAYQKPAMYLETNVRTVFLHELFPGEEGVSDKQLEPLVAVACPDDDPRGWYYALLDYGAHLKAIMPNPSRRSKHHTRQSTFEGSHRQKRGELIRIVLSSPGIGAAAIARELDAFEAEHGRDPLDPQVLDTLLAELVAEGFFRKEGDSYRC
jgi:A/G-specific adenine glycosylase